MSRYIVWLTPYTGEYVKAHRVEEFEGKLLFIQTKGVVDLVVKDYRKSDVIDYHEVELS